MPPPKINPEIEIKEDKVVADAQKSKTERVLSMHSLQVLNALEITQNLFDKSIEYHNDDEIISMIANPLPPNSSKEVQFEMSFVSELLEYYEYIEKQTLKTFSEADYSPMILRFIIEDEIWKKYKVELNDFIYFCENKIKDKEIELKLGDLKSSIASLHKLNKSIFIN